MISGPGNVAEILALLSVTAPPLLSRSGLPEAEPIVQMVPLPVPVSRMLPIF
jgi:hypothetical protein